MELEAKILERLQDLRRWQIEQQEHLLKQQQEQRDVLNFEHDRMYQALGLSVQSIVSEDSLAEHLQNSPRKDCNSQNMPQEILSSTTNQAKHFQPCKESGESILSTQAIDKDIIETESINNLNVPQLQLSTNRYLSYKSSNDGFSPRSEIPRDRTDSDITINSERTSEKRHGSEFSMDGIEPLPLDVPAKKHIIIDDLPVPSPKKDFVTLLEERLRDCNMADETGDNKNEKPQVKRPFLRKGQGLARFNRNPDENTTSWRGRRRSVSLCSSMRLPTNSGSKNSTAALKDTPKRSKTIRNSGKSLVVPSVAQTKLSLKNVPPPKRKSRSKSMSSIPNNKSRLTQLKAKPPVEMNNSSDNETKNRRELEEMRIFELLEEKVQNSSFCSNSSTVLALFRQSTPLKMKNPQVNNSRDSKQRLNSDSSSKYDASDTSLEEIVRTTKSNLPVPGSPVTKIRETVIQDYVFSNWDPGSLPDENINTSNSNHIANRPTGSYKSMQHTKHTTIQFNNNNNNINNVCKSAMHSDDETDSCRRNVDVIYDEDYRGTINDRETTDDKENEGANASLHVRFSEYNEYKTIGLTDTSMMSNESTPSRKFMQTKAWSDRSTSPDSSDVEILPSNNKLLVFPGLSDSESKPLPAMLGQKEIRSCGDELSDNTTDEEKEYNSNCSSDTSYNGNDTITDITVQRANSEKRIDSEEGSENCNDSGSTIGQEKDETSMRSSGIDSMAVNNTIFKSDLLKTRLLELEREIEIFRKENTALANQRKKLQDEQRQLQKEFKQKEDILGREKKSMEENMLEERKRLSREKAALENRLKDAREKSLQNKQERQEMQILREQLDELREDMSQKESRWQAAQARQKSQIRVLQTENSGLKQELEKLRASRTNKGRTRRVVPLNTRAIHQINKQLENKKKVGTKKDSSSDEETTGPQMIHRESEIEQVLPEDIERIAAVDGSKTIVYNGIAQQFAKSDDEPRKKRNLYTSLLNEATEGLRGTQEIILGKSVEVLEKSTNEFQRDGIEDEENEERSPTRSSSDSADYRKSDNSFKRYEDKTERYGSPVTMSRNEENARRTSQESSRSSVDRTSQIGEQKAKCSMDVPLSPNERGESVATNKPEIREVRYPDGHTEFWYSNGNVKKIFPDRNVTKMIYYNGDVRESTGDGTVKYFYASTRTWHTTLLDGLEILEFPDGQVERRAKNGTTEVSLPDGSVRLVQSDGTEKWVLPDGTVAETFPDGKKILSFPNGQREVHTKEHKRREYPDGTVKLVYPDGTQETRYATGRVRVKDKDGNLVLDVHHR